MGAGYGKNIKQWSNGDYYLATASWQDDLAIISGQNNGVAYRPDDVGQTLGTAAYLNIATGGSVTNQQGIIGSTGEVDAFRFKTTGGAVNLSITTATSYSPNLDIHAELVNGSSGLQVAATNPDSPELNQTLASTIPAGEYLLKIKGVGYPTPADNSGYSNYGSLGSFRIDGTVAGGQSFRGFSIAENSPNGSNVGTVTPTILTGTLTYTISSGNPGGAFAIGSSTGTLTVANSAELNFETQSTRFDDPATIELFVNITNTTGGSETVRVLATITDVNEAPVISTPGAVTMIENTLAGTPVVQLTATEEDRYQVPVFSITSGNSAGYFAINSSTGQITVATPPSVASDTIYNLLVQATDAGGQSSSTTVNVTVLNLPAGFTSSPGGLYRTFFNNIGGTAVADLTGNAAFPNSPDHETFLTSFDGGSYGDNYGSTIRGYLIPPATGAYTFYIASDDASLLILGASTTQVSSPVIASISGWSNPYDWDADPNATSGTYNLTAGQPYYIEMRHKEGGGGDHAAAAWSGPGISRQVIPGRYLAPFVQNYAPRPTGSMSVSEVATAGTVIGNLAVTEVNAGQTLSNYSITAGNEAGLFAIDANTGVVTLAQAGQFNPATTPYYDITFSVTDSGSPSLTGSGVVRISVIAYALYFDPNGTTAGSVTNGGDYSWVGNNWVGAQGGVSATGGWVSGAKANFAATSPASPLAYNVSIAGYNSGVNGGISSIDALNGTVSFTGNVDNFYLVNPMTVRAAAGAAIRFNQTSGTPGLGFNLNGKTATFEGDVAFATSGIGNNGNVVVNSGTLGLNSPSQYIGMTTINGGTLALAGSGQIYSTLNWGNATVTVNTGGVLQSEFWEEFNSSLGQLGYHQANLVLNGGTLRYTGGTNPTGEGRGFTIGAGGATLESTAPTGQVWNINDDSRSVTYGIASNGGALTLSGSGDGRLTKALAGTGALVKNGSGTWTLDATNTYSGSSTVNGGTLVLPSPASLPGAVTITGDTGSVPGGTLSMQQPGIVTWSRNVSGGGRWKVATGSGSQTVSLTGSYTGFTGVLEVASGSGKIHLATSTRYPSSSATLRLTANTTAYITGGNTFASKIEMYGGAIGEPTFGQLRVATANLTLSGTVKLFGSTSIAVDNPRAAILSGVISESGGSFGLTKNQTGTLTISNNSNAYSGGTVHAAGVLRTGTSGGKFGIGNLTVADGLTTLIRHTGGNALGRQAYVYLNGTTSLLSIAAGGTETVSRLYLNGVQQPPGTYNTGRITGGGSLVVGEIAPNAPTSLSANPSSAVSVQLAWTHASANDTAIKVERSLSAGSGFVEIASLPGTARSYENTGLEANTTYYYRILAVNAVGNSPYSTVASTITPLPAAPIGLLATAGPGQVSLSWNASAGAASYVVRRSNNSGGPYTDVATPSAASYLNSGLLDATYYYVVAAVAPNGGIGDQSAEVSATPSLADSNGVWNLASGGDWMSAGNWQSSVIAIGADRSASFPLSAGGSINQNRSGLALGALSFSNGNYTIAGNALTMDVATGTPAVSVGTGVTATIATTLNGNDGLAKSGDGTLRLTAYNNYTGGTTVNGGTLEVAGASGGWGLLRSTVTVNAGATMAITGGDGTGFGWENPVTGLTVNGGTVTAPGASHIGFGAYTTASLNNGGTISGNWQWNGDGGLGFSSSGNTTNTISGSLVLRADAGANHTFTVADGTAPTDLQVNANLSDQYPEVWWVPASGLVKTGAGTMVLSGSNSHDGVTDILAGTLVAAHNNALGAGGHSGATMTYIRDGATLALQGGISSNEHFHFWGTGVGGLGSLRSLSGDNALTDSYVLRSNVTVGVDAGSLTVPFFYQDGGGFSLSKVGNGTLTLSGVSSHSGGTTVNAGKLVLANGDAGGTGRISGALTVNSGATVETTGDGTGLGWTDQISSVTLNGGTLTSAGTNHVWNIPGGITMTGGTLQSNNGTSDPSGPQLEWNRTSVTTLASADTATIGGRIRMRPDLGDSGILFTVADGSAATDLLVSAAITQGSGGLGITKAGPGKLMLTGTSNYTGATSVLGGTLEIGGSLGNTAVTVSSATLAGNGTLGGAVSLGNGGNLATRISDWTGTGGSGFEDLSAQSLVIQTGTPHVITVDTSGLTNFTETTKTFPILLTAGGITGFSAGDFSVSAPGFPGTGTWAVQKNGNNLELVYSPVITSPYDAWAAVKSLTGANDGISLDPDHDGLTNLQEFAFDGNPLSPANDGKRVANLADPDGAGTESITLIYTIPVRDGAVFHGPGDLVSDPVDGIVYQIQGSADLIDFTTSNISEVTPAQASGLPALSPGWSYRTFFIPGSPTVRAFIRAVVVEVP
jgi:autotransporter-associated beta strand protein